MPFRMSLLLLAVSTLLVRTARIIPGILLPYFIPGAAKKPPDNKPALPLF